MTSIFLNARESRLKTGWRLLIFLCVFWICASLIFLIKPLLGDIGKKEFLQDYSLLIVTILAFAATLSIYFARKHLDKKTFTSLGLKMNKRTFQDIIFGFLLSGLMAGLFFMILISCNLIEYNGIHIGASDLSTTDGFNFVRYMKVISIGSLLLLLLEHILVGYWEEIFFRGYLFQNMIDGLGLKIAIIISCILYGLIHAMNPNAGILSSLIILLFGFLRIYGYLSTKLLWLSIGMHIGWNFFQGPIFGFAASGHQKATLLNSTFISEKDWLTGGAFGPEGSIIIIPILMLALWIMRWYSKKYHSETRNPNRELVITSN